MLRKNELKLLWPFYAHSLFLALFKVIMPFYVLYFLGIGLSFFQIAIIGSIRSVISIIFEIPTGAIADLYGRKTSVILGYILTAATLLLIPFFKNFYIITIIFAFDAIFETLFSGADKAWVVDALNEKNKDLVDVYFIRSSQFKNIGLIISPLIAGTLVSFYGMKILWFVFAGGMLLSSIFLFFGKEAKNQQKNLQEDKKSELSKNFIYQIKDSAIFVLKNSAVMLLFLSIFIFYFVEETTSLAWTPYLESAGISLAKIGYLFSVIAAIGIVIPFFIEIMLKKKDKLLILFAASLAYAFLLFAIGFTDKVLLILIIFILFTSMEEILLPLKDALINSYIQSKNRATVLSLKSMIECLASIIGGPIAGLLLNVISLKQALVLSGFLLLTIPFIFFILKRNKEMDNMRPSPL